jgi:hypothetical protein
MIKKYRLDFEKAQKYLEENLKGANRLSDAVISFLKFESCDFFALLTEKSKTESINEFDIGGKTHCLRDDVGTFVFNLIRSNRGISFIFDDFNSDENNVRGDLLFNSNGVCFENEIYYLIDKNATQDLVIQCLRRSNVVWHSLCIGSVIQFKEHKKAITLEDMKNICLNAKFILIGAYDSESYIIWEKRVRAITI